MSKTPISDAAASRKTTGHGESDMFVPLETAQKLERRWIEAHAEINRIREVHALQMAACMTAALQNTPSTARERIGKDNPYWTQCYADVCAAVDREMKLRDEVHALKADLEHVARERDDARAWVERLQRDRQTLTCVYCGQEYPPGTPAHGSNVLTEHIKVCAQHPMRAVEARVKELEQALLDAQLGADGLLKTAHEREDALKAKVEAEFPTAEEYEGAAGDMREVIDNLALLLRRTSRRLDPRDRLRTECVDYLKKIGQAGQPLRPWCKTASKSPNLDTQPPAG